MKKEDVEKKELLQKTTNNQVKLLVLEGEAKEFDNYMKREKMKNTENIEEKNNKKYEENQDFFKNQQEPSTVDSNLENKTSFITSKLLKLEKFKENLKGKVKDYSEETKHKQVFFDSLESEIQQFSLMIVELKEENRQLRRELELLIEKETKENEKKSLEKENQNLEDKIEKLKNKKTNSQEQAPEKINKVTYDKNQQMTNEI